MSRGFGQLKLHAAAGADRGDDPVSRDGPALGFETE